MPVPIEVVSLTEEPAPSAKELAKIAARRRRHREEEKPNAAERSAKSRESRFASRDDGFGPQGNRSRRNRPSKAEESTEEDDDGILDTIASYAKKGAESLKDFGTGVLSEAKEVVTDLKDWAGIGKEDKKKTSAFTPPVTTAKPTYVRGQGALSSETAKDTKKQQKVEQETPAPTPTPRVADDTATTSTFAKPKKVSMYPEERRTPAYRRIATLLNQKEADMLRRGFDRNAINKELKKLRTQLESGDTPADTQMRETLLKDIY